MMYKAFCILSLLFAITVADAQTDFPGSKFSIIIPEGFAMSANSASLRHPTYNASIEVMELEDVPFEMMKEELKMEEEFTLEILVKEEVRINGYEGILYKNRVVNASPINQLTDFKAYEEDKIGWVLAFGDESKTLVLTANYSYHFDDILNSNVRNSLLSILYDENRTLNPFDKLCFEVDDSKSPYKFAKVMYNTGAVYTLDEQYDNTKPPAQYFMINVLPISFINDMHYSMAESISTRYMLSFHIEEYNSINLSEIKGYEFIIKETDENEIEHINYSVVLFDDDKIFHLKGVSNTQFKKSISTFRKLAQQFKRKS